MKKDKILSSSLSELVEKYFQQDIIAEMEKLYQSAPAKLIPITEIDDTSYIKDVAIPEETIAYFASGLTKRGFYNPLAVRRIDGGRYEVILGRKRFYGAKRAGILSLPCVIIDCSEEEILLMLLADTRDQREGNVVEMALVCEELAKSYGYTQQTLADVSHQSRSQITNTLRILALPKSALNKISTGELSYGHAKAVASLPRSKMDEVLSRIAKEKLSVRQTENLVKMIREDEEGKAPNKPILSESEKAVTISFSSKQEKEDFLKEIAPLLEK